MISRDEILKGREKEYPLTPELEANLADLLVKANKFRATYGSPLIVTSGYRPGKYNVQAGGATNSTHLTCQAVDLEDSQGTLAKWCQDHIKVLEDCGLYMESPDKTPGWVHLQTRATRNRIFIP